jgi:phosphatidylinositol glycan class N
VTSTIVFLVLAGMIWIQKMPALYYAYVFFPVFFWDQVAQNVGTLKLSGALILSHGYCKPLLAVTGTLLALEALVS